MPSTWSDIAGGLTSQQIESLRREDLPPGYQFLNETEMLEEIARDASVAAYMSERELWGAPGLNPQNAEAQADGLAQLITQLERFEVSPGAANPNKERQEIVDGIRAHRDWLAKNVRPYRAPEADTVPDERQRILAVLDEIVTLRNEAVHTLDTIRTRAAETGAVSAATLYKDRATAEDTAGRWAAWGVTATMAGFVVTALVLFEWWAPDPDAKTGAAISAIAGRALVLATIAYGITFFAKNFRAHRHLAAVNRFKANALEATPLLREGIATDDQRDVIVGELVRAVFAVPETGFVDANGESVTIQTPVHALINGMGSTRSTSA